ncbi:MAG: YfbM family protein [Propionibacteriaceae bacterium]|nr:YfbM family protein [Propionibacteriaceae bacterium]
MGMLASYQAVDDAALASTMNLDEDDLVELVEQFCEDDTVPGYDLDKNWDMLHFILTAASASQPIDGDPLSEAIVGARAYDVELFIGATEAAEVVHVLDALQDVDIDDLRGRCNLATFRKYNLYPSLSETTQTEEDSLWQILKAEFEGLLGFYSDAAARSLNVVVSIY